jgi:hypothetical protein
MVNADVALEMIFSGNRKKKSALLYLPFDSSGCGSGSRNATAASYEGGTIFDGPGASKIGAGTLQTGQTASNLCWDPPINSLCTVGIYAATASDLSATCSLAGGCSLLVESLSGCIGGAYFLTGKGSACYIAAASGTEYVFTAHVLPGASVSEDKQLAVGATFNSSTGAQLSSCFIAYTLEEGATSWKRVGGLSMTPPAWTTFVVPYVYTGDTTQGHFSYYVDAIQLEKTAYETPYIDGSLGEGHSWDGTANDSQSVRTSSFLVYDNPGGAIDECTIAWWYRGTGLNATSNWNYNFHYGDDGTNGRIFAAVDSTGGNVTAQTMTAGFVRTGCTTGFVSDLGSGCVIAKETWNHFIVTASGLTTASPWMKLYQNGALGGSLSGSFAVNGLTEEFCVGNWNPTPNFSANGWVDELILLESALDATDALWLFNSQNAGRSLETETGIWTDATADVVRDVVIKYGLKGAGATDRVAQAGTMNFVMQNDHLNSGTALGYYSPDHANVRTGFDVGTPARLKLAYSGSTRYKWMGHIDSIKPIPGRYSTRQSNITATDWFDVAAKTKVSLRSIQFNVGADTGIDDLVSAMTNTPSSSTLSAGQDIFPTIFDSSRDEATAVTTEFNRLVLSELGYLYLRGNASSGGELVFEDRHTRPKYGAAAASMGSGCLATLAVDRSTRQVYNRVKIEVNPREIDTSASVLFTLQSVPLVPVSGSTIIEGRYTDPVQRGTLRIGGTSMIATASDTDYKMWSASDATGTDLTANLSVTTCYGGNTVRYEISNDGNTSGYITLLQARGKAVAVREPSISDKKNEASIAAYGESVLRLNMPYQEDALVADDVAAATLLAWKDPVSIGKRVSFIGNVSDDLMSYGLLYEPGDKIRISEEVTGIDADYFINGVTLKIDKDNILTYTWLLTPAERQAYWILGTAGFSEVGTTTTIGY